MVQPEDKARENIDRMLADSGWEVRNLSEAEPKKTRSNRSRVRGRKTTTMTDKPTS
jgi:type I site-specific restriction endonuclease